MDISTIKDVNVMANNDINTFKRSDISGEIADIVKDEALCIEDIIPFENNPFHEYNSVELKKLANSIKENGIINPLIFWENENNDYILLSGHNRLRALKELGYKSLDKNMYKVLKGISKELAEIIVVESNLMQREVILPSEKAYAYKIKLNAIKRQGKRTDLTYEKVDNKDSISEDTKRQMQRYVRLTYLIKPLLDIVDKRKGFFLIGVELSYLKDNEQELVYNFFFGDKKVEDSSFLNLSLARLIKLKSREVDITFEILNELISADKGNNAKNDKVIQISINKLEEISGMQFKNSKEAKEYVLKCIFTKDTME